MKKILTLLLASSALFSFAQNQGPVIEGTYLPVRGTAIKEVWNSVPGQVTIPVAGTNVTWDYSTESTYFTDTFKIETFHPDSTPNQYNQYFPTATHASYLRTPFNNLSDSLYSYYIIDTAGLHMIGGFSQKNATSSYVGNDTVNYINPKELYVPSLVTFGAQMTNVSNFETYGKFQGNPIKVKGKKIKNFSGIGYGKLILPNGDDYDNVLLAKIVVDRIDTAFNVITVGDTVPLPQFSLVEYSFLRNNTFGSSSLMYFSANTETDIKAQSAWYTLPVDFGYISGTVYTDSSESTPVTQGEMFLYREHSNFSKDDILARTNLDANGNYKFDSIPFGEYRISVRPDTSLLDNPYAFTTYWGDVTDWLTAPTVNTINPNDSSSDDNNIHLRYYPAPQGQGEISGNLNLDGDVRGSNPIPGVDIIVKKNPGGGAFRETQTDMQGDYSLANLDDGDYTLFVDIPGLHVKTTYDFEIVGGTVIGCLDFTSGTDSIHADYSAPPPACSSTSIKGNALNQLNSMQAYPNPYTASTTIKVDIAQKSDILLEVYNVLGEKITTLDKGVKQAGQYSYNFNAKSLNHASGLYFVKLLVNNKIDVLRILEQ